MRSLFNHLEMQRFHRYLLWFLVIDLAVSALALVWLLGARRTQAATDAEVSEAVAVQVSAVETAVSVPPGPAPNGAEAKQQAELRNLRRDIQTTQGRIDAEVERQAPIAENVASRWNFEELTMAEFQERFPQEYEKFQKRGENMRKIWQFSLERRQQALAELSPEGLTAEEYSTLRTVFEYLVECDQRIMEGRRVDDKPASLPDREALLEMVDKFCRIHSGCTSEALEVWNAIYTFQLGRCFMPFFIVEQSVVDQEKP